MICPNCHSNLPDGSRFCPHCGAMLQPMGQPQQPMGQPGMYQQPMMPQPQPRPKNNTLLIIVIAAASVIICGLLLFVFLGKSDDKKTSDSTAVTSETPVSDYSSTTASGLDENQYNWLSEREVTAADLSGKSAGDLRLMRNAIFARHGYKFKSADLQEYFANFSWYSPKYADVSSMLTPVEKKNVEFIQKFEGGGSGGGSKSQSKGSLRNVGFTSDYSDWVCYTWLNDSDISHLSSSELRILRNTIYARHGRKFKSADLRNYFSGFSWYTPRYDEISESSLSETERHNIMLIKKYE